MLRSSFILYLDLLEKKAFSITVAFPTRQPYIDIVFKPLTFA